MPGVSASWIIEHMFEDEVWAGGLDDDEGRWLDPLGDVLDEVLLTRVDQVDEDRLAWLRGGEPDDETPPARPWTRARAATASAAAGAEVGSGGYDGDGPGATDGASVGAAAAIEPDAWNEWPPEDYPFADEVLAGFPDSGEEANEALPLGQPFTAGPVEVGGWRRRWAPLLSGQPGAATAVALARMPIADVDDDLLLEAIRARGRLAAWNDAGQALLITELAHRRAATAVTELTARRARGIEAVSLGARAVVDEIAAELVISRHRAGSLTDTALGLSLDCPDTLSALARGDIDTGKAESILDHVQRIVSCRV